ncbi:MAG TPA: hypothetical protein DDZ38_13535 [Gammaproteobacteria bacterium]|nr:hypothetical protein [Gammaproteobacteria bacterium]|tara:strand:+ start:15982 stop:16464 length:483 start_codon:yes stop_codon:yes gene_type:complete
MGLMKSISWTLMVCALMGCATTQQRSIDLALVTREAGQAYAAGDCARATALYREIIAQVPDEKGSLLKIANCTYLSGDRRSAIDQYRQILATAPEYRAAWYNLTYLQLEAVSGTLAGLIKNVPPSSEEEKQLIEMSLKLLQVYNEGRKGSAVKDFDVAPR